MFGEQATDAMNPLVIPLLAGLTADDIELEFFDDRIERLPDRIETDVLVMTVETFTAKRAYLLARKYKRDGMQVIMGGFHPTMLPEESLRYADCVVVGEAEDVWPQVIKDLRRNSLQRIYRSNYSADISSIKYQNGILSGKKYNPINLVQCSRGCKYNCDFCSVHAFYGAGVRQRATQMVIREIEASSEKLLFFIDDNIFYNEKQAVELVSALIPLKKQWVCQVSIDVARNKDLLALMRKSGCILVVIGFESLNNRNLEQMGKTANLRNNDYAALIQNIYDAGIMIYGSFVFGYDCDTAGTIRDTLRFALQHKFAIANFNPLMPMPGTQLYRRLQAEGRLLHDKWWLDDSYRYGDAMFVPNSMTPAELTDGCRDARYEFNSFPNMVRRMLNFRSNSRSLKNAAVYTLMNIVSRREIYRKQGQLLGGNPGEGVHYGTDRQCL